MTKYKNSKKNSSGCVILICGFLAWIFVLGCALMIIGANNYKTVCVAAGEKVFFPAFVQFFEKKNDAAVLNSFSNDYFHLLDKIQTNGLAQENIVSISNLFASAHDKKITKIELESFSNSVWKTVNSEK